MKTIVFLLEEPSAKHMLEGLLPRILPEDVSTRFLVFQGKQDLEKNLIGKLRGWQMPESVFIIMRDQDSGNCETVKGNLKELCREAGREDALVRVACRELESFYLGELAAVEKGLELTGIARMQDNSKFRNPDRLGSPAAELERLTKGGYQKVAGSRAIGPHLTPGNNKSRSFQVLVEGILKMAE